MQYRVLGATGLELSAVGLGAWAIGGPGYAFGWGPQQDNDSIETIHAALDAGINWIDTAPVYGLGHSEIVVGKALAEVSARPMISSKCGLVWQPGTSRVRNELTAASVTTECEESLRRLKVDCIDIYHIHWPVPAERIEEAWEAIGRLIDAGKVRLGAVSNFSRSQLEQVQAIRPVSVLQPPYSMLERSVEQEHLPYCVEHGIGVLSYSPLQNGLLTGKVTSDWVAALPKSDWRKRNSEFNSPRLEANLDLVTALQNEAEQLTATVGQLAIAWVLQNPAVSAAIVGARKPEQIRETAQAADTTFPGDLMHRVSELIAARDARVAGGA